MDLDLTKPLHISFYEVELKSDVVVDQSVHRVPLLPEQVVACVRQPEHLIYVIAEATRWMSPHSCFRFFGLFLEDPEGRPVPMPDGPKTISDLLAFMARQGRKLFPDD